MKCAYALILILASPLSSTAESEAQAQQREITIEQKDDSPRLIEPIPYLTGKVTIEEANATLNLPQGCRFIEAESAKVAFPDFFSNPQDPASTVVGIVTPADTKTEPWVLIVEFYHEGYIPDERSDLFSFENVFSGLKAADTESLKARVRHKDDSLKLIGWAIEPSYDEQRKILTWAEGFQSGASKNSIISYNARLLSRRGMLKMQAVTGAEHLNQIEAAMPKIVNGVTFDQGEEYRDFNPATDKKSDYVFASLMHDHLTEAKFHNRTKTLSNLQKSTFKIGMEMKVLMAIGAFVIFFAYRKINSDD